MKILYVLDKMHHLAGMERILTSKMNYIADNTNNQVYFTTYEQNNVPIPFSLSEKVIYRPIEVPMVGREGLRFFQWMGAYMRTRKQFKNDFGLLLKSVLPDIIICTTYSFAVLDIILLLSEEYTIKTIIESHTKFSAVLLSGKYRYSRILYLFVKMWDNTILKTLKYGSCMVTLTKADACYWNQYISRVEIIPNMITVNSVAVSDYESKKVISVGRYSYEKGFDMLIEAWNLVIGKHPDWKLYIYGNGDRSEFESLVEHLQLKDSVFCMPGTKDIVSAYTKCSIYVMSSRYEGFGLVLTEAMSCGLPCISFDCPYGPSEIIDNGKDGYLVERNNIHLLAEKIDELMDDSDLRKRLGSKARQNVMRYNKKNIMQRWIALLETS